MSAVAAAVAAATDAAKQEGNEANLAAMQNALKQKVDMPAELAHKRRMGMAASSGYARWRGARFRTRRLGRATGPLSYDHETPNRALKRRRAAERYKAEHV